MLKPQNGKRLAPAVPGAGIFGGPLEDATLLPSAVGATLWVLRGGMSMSKLKYFPR